MGINLSNFLSSKSKNTKMIDFQDLDHLDGLSISVVSANLYKENFKYVGDNFAYEARTIHYNSKKKSKGIYGSASQQDLKELKEEGIEAQIIPWVDENKN